MSATSEIKRFVENFIPSAESIEDAPWVVKLEKKVGLPLSKSYKILLTSYKFSEFEMDEADFFCNLNSSSHYDIGVRVFKDSLLFTSLSRAGFFHIGFPYQGDYNPVCFDTNKKSNNGDFPIVKIEHESILYSGKASIIDTIAPSFYEYVKCKNNAY